MSRCTDGSRVRGMALILTIVFVAATSSAQFDDSEPNADLLDHERTTVALVQRYGPSVVTVNVEVEGRRVDPFEGLPDDFVPPQFREFFEQEPQPRQGAGSGFVVSDELHIVTNYHVIGGALREGTVELQEQATLTVVFPGQEPLDAEVLGANALYDLAVLRLVDPGQAPTGIEPIPIGDSDRIQVGQQSIAIGNPFGLDSTVTSGIVSGIGRDLLGAGEVAIPMIQTDAAINPGNSGGPLLGTNGELIGINTAMLPGGGMGRPGFIGVGFAIPSNLLRDSLDELVEGGLVDLASRARLGISVLGVAAFPDALRERLALPETGVMIIEVAPGSPADEAGLQGADAEFTIGRQTVPVGGDIIQGLNGEEVDSAAVLQRLVFEREAGNVVELEVWREGEVHEVVVELREIEDGPEQQQPQPQPQSWPQPRY